MSVLHAFSIIGAEMNSTGESGCSQAEPRISCSGVNSTSGSHGAQRERPCRASCSARGIQGSCIPGPSRGLIFPFPESWVWSMGLESTDHRWWWILAFSGVPLGHMIDEATELQIGQLMSLSWNARASMLPCPDIRGLPGKWFSELGSLSLPQVMLVFCCTKNTLSLFLLESQVRK